MAVATAAQASSRTPTTPQRSLLLPADKAPPPTLIVVEEEEEADDGGQYCCYLGRVFRRLDEDGDGKISPSELRSCMVRTVGEELSEEEAQDLVGSTDSDGDGLLGFHDFVRLVEPPPDQAGGDREEQRTRDLRAVFAMYAEGGPAGPRPPPRQQQQAGGTMITPRSLRRMLAKLGEWRSLDECRAMIERFDLDGDGLLSFDEFTAMML